MLAKVPGEDQRAVLVSVARGLDAPGSAFSPRGFGNMARRSQGDFRLCQLGCETGRLPQAMPGGGLAVGDQPVVSAKRTWMISNHWEINHRVPQRNRCLRECLTSKARPMLRCWRRHAAVAISGSARRGL